MMIYLKCAVWVCFVLVLNTTFFLPRHQGKHCLLEAELSCVKDLLRRDIYPIIIHVKISEKNVKKLR